MTAREGVVEVVRGWVEKAENDLLNAVHTMKLGEECPTDTVCFHAQQCIEKYLKAFLALKGIDFPKTHDIGEIVALLPPPVKVELPVEYERRITMYATTARYPGDYEFFSLAEARAAIRIARQVRREIRRHMPKETLVRKVR
jgi:HEPN domain-containing protein